MITVLAWQYFEISPEEGDQWRTRWAAAQEAVRWAEVRRNILKSIQGV